jgi:flagellar basal-body rod modification protein FlgD
MTPTVSSSTGAQTASGSTSATQTASVDKNMFLQLLVAQLQNQDPLNPTDGTQFLGELAQFQQLEQSANTGEDVTAIRQDLDKLAQGTQSTNGQS